MPMELLKPQKRSPKLETSQRPLKATIKGAIMTDSKRILMGLKGDLIDFLGGKPEQGERFYLETLEREIREEVPGTELDLENAKFYDEFHAKTPYGINDRRAIIFLVPAIRIGQVQPQSDGGEINSLVSIGRDNVYNYLFSPIAARGLNRLLREGYI